MIFSKKKVTSKKFPKFERMFSKKLTAAPTQNRVVRKMSSQNTPTTNIMSSTAPAKTTKKATKTAAAPEPVAAPAPAPVASETKKVVARKASPSASTTATATVVTAPVVVAPVSAPVADAAPTTAAPATSLDEDLKALLGNLNTLRETASAMVAQVKKLEKRVHREIKDARKRKRRAKVDENGNEVKRAPSIFERPTAISDELCRFLGKATGSQMSRSEVTKAVNSYIKEKNLKNKHDIKPDASLKKLLNAPEGEQLTYFNLQRYLNRHYIKTA
jgi:chromatin remodeling complex protein RSC6